MYIFLLFAGCECAWIECIPPLCYRICGSPDPRFYVYTLAQTDLRLLESIYLIDRVETWIAVNFDIRRIMKC